MTSPNRSLPYQIGISPHTRRIPLSNKDNYYINEGSENQDRSFNKHLLSTQVKPQTIKYQSDQWQMYSNNSGSCKNTAKLSLNTTQLNKDNEYEDCIKLSLEQINKELDQNINDLVYLLNRRRALVQVKRVKLCDEFNNKIADISHSSIEQIYNELKSVDDETVKRLIQDQDQLQKISHMINESNNQNGRKRIREEELSRSQDFWNTNKQIESEIDSLLQNLKNVDKEIINRNEDIKEECHKLDDLDDKIRELLIHKSQDSLSRAEPIFQLKQKMQDQLNQRLKQQNIIKQEKMTKISKIISLLNQLKDIRELRYKAIRMILGQNDSDSTFGFSQVIQNIETLSQIQDQLVGLDSRDSTISNELDKQGKENQAVFSEVIKKASEEARVFSEWAETLRKRLRYHKILNYYSSIMSVKKSQHVDMKQLVKLIKEEMIYLKPLSDENASIKGGIVKTNETTKTFQDILNTLANENQRRKELLVVLEQCQYLRHQEEQKTEQLRVVQLEIVKKNQQKRHLQEDLENVLGDADLSTFKKIEGLLNGFDHELSSLNYKKNEFDQELQNINQKVEQFLVIQVFQEIDIILHEYSDILNDILPVNWVSTYDLKKTQHLKMIKTQLKKTLKRIGIID